MPRAIWKGAISFGLVHIPVALYPASSETGIDFDWLDKKSMDPVGYKRVNKRTGKEVDKDQIVKGIKVEGGDYVLLSAEEIEAAYPKTTQTIEIQAFVKAGEIAFTYLETPYVLEPVAKGEKVYALLREAMLDAGVIGVARLVMHTKEHLAALIPAGPALMLNTLRWAQEIRPLDELKAPPAGRKNLKEGELKMARQLIKELTEPWKPERYEDQFSSAVLKLVEKRVAAGKTEQIEPLEDAAPVSASNVVDLTELLAQSLKRKPAAAKTTAGKSATVRADQSAKKSSSKTTPKTVRKTASKTTPKAATQSHGRTAAETAARQRA